MPRYQHKNIIYNIQGNISPLKPSNPTTVGTEYSKIAEAQAKDLKEPHVYKDDRGS